MVSWISMLVALFSCDTWLRLGWRWIRMRLGLPKISGDSIIRFVKRNIVRGCVPFYLSIGLGWKGFVSSNRKQITSGQKYMTSLFSSPLFSSYFYLSILKHPNNKATFVSRDIVGHLYIDLDFIWLQLLCL
jgi:hypothetical protein